MNLCSDHAWISWDRGEYPHPYDVLLCTAATMLSNANAKWKKTGADHHFLVGGDKKRKQQNLGGSECGSAI